MADEQSLSKKIAQRLSQALDNSAPTAQDEQTVAVEPGNKLIEFYNKARPYMSQIKEAAQGNPLLETGATMLDKALPEQIQPRTVADIKSIQAQYKDPQAMVEAMGSGPMALAKGAIKKTAATLTKEAAIKRLKEAASKGELSAANVLRAQKATGEIIPVATRQEAAQAKRLGDKVIESPPPTLGTLQIKSPEAGMQRVMMHVKSGGEWGL